MILLLHMLMAATWSGGRKCSDFRGGGREKQVDAGDERYRNLNVFRYWFRAVAENAPWVHKIYVVTDNQTPEWLNTDDEKIVPVNHSDFIPEKYLPLFHSGAIEVNLHRIPGLSDTFVYFCDDMYLNKSVKEEDFFENGLPKYYAGQNLFKQDCFDSYQYHCFTAMTAVNSSVPKCVIRNAYQTKLLDPVLGEGAKRNHLLTLLGGNERVVWFEDEHLPTPLLRTTMEKFWRKETALLEKTSSCRFRGIDTVTQAVFRYYDCARGNFIPRARWDGYYRQTQAGWEEDLREGKNRCICINDNHVAAEELPIIQQRIIDAFESRYPNKCRFEK